MSPVPGRDPWSRPRSPHRSRPCVRSTCPTARRCWAVGSTSATTSFQAVGRRGGHHRRGRHLDGPDTSADGRLPVGHRLLDDQVVHRGRARSVSPGSAREPSSPPPTAGRPGPSSPCRRAPRTSPPWPAGRTGAALALGVVSGRVTTLTSSSSGAWTAGGGCPPRPRRPRPCRAPTAPLLGHVRTSWSTSATPSAWSPSTSTGGAPGPSRACRSDRCAPRHRLHPGTSHRRALAAGTCVRTASRPAPPRPPHGHRSATCVAVGTTATVFGGARTGQGVVLTTTDGGVTWLSAQVTPTARRPARRVVRGRTLRGRRDDGGQLPPGRRHGAVRVAPRSGDVMAAGGDRAGAVPLTGWRFRWPWVARCVVAVRLRGGGHVGERSPARARR